MFIDGIMIAISDEQYDSARMQLDLPPGFVMVEATTQLHHDTGNGHVSIPLPHGYIVAAFERSGGGCRSYGVVFIKDLYRIQASD
ncbi:hypothetical protein HZF02_29235 [Pseudomonas yamanorum]|nr:hypothetical protein HZF02_29235 [Pseudomonas yamanorum]